MILRRPFSHGGPTGSLGNKMEDLRSGTRGNLGRREPGSGMQEVPQPHPARTTCLRLLHGPYRPAGPGHVTTSPPLALSRGSSPPRRPFFSPPSESQDLSAAPFRNPSAHPRLPPPTPPTLQLFLAPSRPVSTTSNEKNGPFFPKGQATTVNGRRVRGRGAARLGDSFPWRRLQRPWTFHDGGEVLYVQDGGAL